MTDVEKKFQVTPSFLPTGRMDAALEPLLESFPALALLAGLRKAMTQELAQELASTRPANVEGVLGVLQETGFTVGQCDVTVDPTFGDVSLAIELDKETFRGNTHASSLHLTVFPGSDSYASAWSAYVSKLGRRDVIEWDGGQLTYQLVNSVFVRDEFGRERIQYALGSFANYHGAVGPAIPHAQRNAFVLDGAQIAFFDLRPEARQPGADVAGEVPWVGHHFGPHELGSFVAAAMRPFVNAIVVAGIPSRLLAAGMYSFMFSGGYCKTLTGDIVELDRGRIPVQLDYRVNEIAPPMIIAGTEQLCDAYIHWIKSHG